jgi:hypothetical protein
LIEFIELEKTVGGALLVVGGIVSFSTYYPLSTTHSQLIELGVIVLISGIL